MKKIYLLGLLIFLFESPLNSQTTKFGKPDFLLDPSLSTRNFRDCEAVNNQLEKNLSLLNETKVFRFGKELELSIDICKEGDILLTETKRITQFGIQSKGALSINLIFDVFQLAKNAKLYLFNPDNLQFVGAYTSLNNNQNNALGTELVPGEKLIVWLEESPKEPASQLHLSTVVHGFEDINSLAKSLGSSGNCHYDVNCPEGNGWNDQTKSVAMMVNGGGFCTGALVHNTSGQVKPYFLSANHCGTNPATWVFRFRWEAPYGQTVCGVGGTSGNGPENMNVNGGVLRAAWAGSDFTLTELNAIPDPSWNIYYAGWDHTENPVSAATGIHHPSGDIKKISLELDALTSSSWSGTPTNSHWHVPNWDKGVTEPGSSGSPLFDQNRRIIGQLHGGASACGGQDLSDEYGKFSFSWEGGGTPATRLKDWLDPDTTGALAIDGFDPNGSSLQLDATLVQAQGVNATYCGAGVSPQITLMNNGLDTLTSASIYYGFDGVLDQQITWNGILTRYQVATISLPNQSFSNGNHVFKAVVFLANGQQDENQVNDTITSQFVTIVGGEYIHLQLILDCWGSETSWEVQQLNGTVLYTSPGYSDNQPGLVSDSFCLSQGCYTFKIMDQYGDGMSGCNSGNGSFSIDDNGIVLAQLDPTLANFQYALSTEFCFPSNSLEEFANDFLVYPNPTVGIFRVLGEWNTYQIRSVSGQVILQGNLSQESNLIDLTSEAQGIYMLELSNEQGAIRTIRIIRGT